MMRLTFVGTGGGMPTPERALPSLAVRFAGSLLIFDCGEGTQRQLLNAGLGFPESTHVFITHLHADHYLGVAGLIATMDLLRREAPLFVHGPEGTGESLELLLRGARLNPGFDVVVREVGEGEVMSARDFVVEAIWSRHTVPSLSYRLRERDRPGRMNVELLESIGLPKGPLWGELQRGKSVVYGGRTIRPEEAVGPPRRGRVVVYSGDSAPFEGMVEFARGADVLVHESTYDSSLRSKAEEDLHSTAADAATIASRAGVKLLVLYHLSSRYRGRWNLLLEEARSVFPNVLLPWDLQSIEVTR
ncbi:MAG: ribonuclease Z [Candidatus Caldarchaeales archaeon]